MRTWAVAVRILRQFKRDRRTLAMMFLAPIIVLFLLHTIFASPEYKPRILVSNLNSSLVNAIKDTGARVSEKSKSEALADLKNVKADGLVIIDSKNNIQIYLEGSDPSKTAAVMQAVQKASSKVQISGLQSAIKNLPQLSKMAKLKTVLANINNEPKIHYIHGKKDMKTFDYFGPVFIGFFIFLFVFLTSGISFLRERTGGTIERIMATPLRRWEMVFGYLLGFGLFVLLQSAIVAFAGIYWIKLPLFGAFYNVLLISLLLALVALTLGMLVSAFANTELQVIQLLQLIVVPQIFFSGVFDLSNTPFWMQRLSDIMPLTYGAHALRGVMLRGFGWQEISSDIYVLFAFVIVLIILNILALKKYRKI